jgi:alpha-tubulin suppressor-like RCC1 family protein
LGLGTWDQNIKVPTKIKAFEDVEIIDIKGGKKHVMFLDATGLIWSAGISKFDLGENLEGQLGLIEDIERANCPMIAPLDAKIVKIKCDKNGHSSYAIDDLGKFYCCGLIQANKDDAPRRQLMFQKTTFSDALSK